MPVLTEQGAQTTKKPNETSINVTPDTETFVIASLARIQKRQIHSFIHCWIQQGLRSEHEDSDGWEAASTRDLWRTAKAEVRVGTRERRD